MNAPTAEARGTLRALLEDFDRVLAGEYEALRRRDTAALEHAVETKHRLIASLGTLGRQCPPPAAEVALTPEETAEWAQIRMLLARCALANRTNGAAIDASRNFVTSLLDLLTGRRPGERVYDARGRLGDSGRSRAWERV
ncbi:MAG TPA: flagellar protein FlgN [Gammaproteobacteria bacterium]|nr:flagellar protein FlgN [Gammaproteobacteria bacterium]